MTYLLKFERKSNQQVLFIFSFIFLIVFNSCKENSNSSDSELINKVNAVQKQMMVQGNISEEEEQAMLSLCSLMSRDDDFDDYGRDDVIIFKDVENGPIYNGCEGLSEEETKKCFKENISKFIKQEFNSSIANALDISEPQQVAAFFVIDEYGNLSGMKIRDAEVTIQAEIARVLKNKPKMKPATQSGIKVPVLCSILVTYGSEIKIEVVYIPSEPTVKN